MHFFSIAAVFLAAGISVFADDGPNTVINTVHITEIVTLVGTAGVQTNLQTVVEYHTILAPGYKHRSVSMPPLKPFTKKRKNHSTKVHAHSTKPKHTHVPKPKIGARDVMVVEPQQNIVVEEVHVTSIEVKTKTMHGGHVEHEKGTKVVEHTVTKAGHHREHVTDAAFKESKKVKKHRKHNKANKVAAAPVKEKRSWGAGWFA